ncbi:sorting nexin-14-like isoform X2 [Oratosquilla oratoria]|uniref:sorting nexin-14-like isoform X2 n=1 Tax=Oratosquilla oratoria TaxID=337810 RepID=UPI003F76C6C4
MGEDDRPSLATLFRDKNVLILSAFVFLLSIFFAIFVSLIVSFVLLVSLATGLILPFILFSDGRPLPNLLSIFTGPDTAGKNAGDIPRSCSVCGGERCQRQHPNTANIFSSHIHTELTVPQSIDEALEELLNMTLDEHVYSWYREVSVHDQLADEIRYTIRYAVSSLANRLTKVDLAMVISENLIPTLVHHLDIYVEGSKRVRGSRSLEGVVLQYLKSGGNLHKALASREDEVSYLRAAVRTLLPYLLPEKYQSCRLGEVFLEELLGRVLLLKLMDLLADPDTVNLLFLLLFSKESMTIYPPSTEPEVLLLKNFSTINTHPRNSVLRSNLSSVLKDQSLLYLFHAFLKEESAINVLQFCLAVDAIQKKMWRWAREIAKKEENRWRKCFPYWTPKVEDFNRHILDPKLSSEQLQQLHHEARELYHTYMVPSAVDRINFPQHIVTDIREIIHGEEGDIVKLRTTRPLFQAYEHAYNLLEHEYLALFMNSHSYFEHLCGSRNSHPYHRNSSRENEGSKGNSMGKQVVRRMGSSLKHIGKQMVLRPNVVVGHEEPAGFDHVDHADDISLLLTEDGSSLSEGIGGGLEGLTTSFRDLTAWRVSIPHVEQRVDVTGKAYYAFIVDVTRIDVTGENPEELHWEVERRYHEFYILETKLTEFHGEFPDKLPPRRTFFTNKGMAFMQERKEVFEKFLQKLLQNPVLKSSQLLFLFLKTKDEFTTTFLPEVSLGRFIRDVPRKLMKERGQHLEPFINVFIATTVTAKTKHKSDWEEGAPSALPLEEDHQTDLCITNTMFKDNSASFLPSPPDTPMPPPPPATIMVSGIFDTILFVGVRVYGLSMQVLRWLMCLRLLCRCTFDAAVAWFLRRRLSQALVPPRIVKLIHLIRDALFIDAPSDRTSADRRARESELRNEIVSLLPKTIRGFLLTEDQYTEGANTLVNLFQHPILNKQLSYVLLDKVLEELFPELAHDFTSPFLQQ